MAYLTRNTTKTNKRSQKGKLLALALVLLGTALALPVKSIAASQTWGYNIAQNNLKAKAEGICRQSTVYDSSVRAYIKNLSCPKSTTSSDSAVAYTTGAYLPSGYSGRYRFCAFIKGSASALWVRTYSGNAFIEKGYSGFNSSSQYGYFCTNFMPVTAPSSMTGNVIINFNGGFVNVAGMVLEKE